MSSMPSACAPAPLECPGLSYSVWGVGDLVPTSRSGAPEAAPPSSLRCAAAGSCAESTSLKRPKSFSVRVASIRGRAASAGLSRGGAGTCACPGAPASASAAAATGGRGRLAPADCSSAFHAAYAPAALLYLLSLAPPSAKPSRAFSTASGSPPCAYLPSASPPCCCLSRRCLRRLPFAGSLRAPPSGTAPAPPLLRPSRVARRAPPPTSSGPSAVASAITADAFRLMQAVLCKLSGGGGLSRPLVPVQGGSPIPSTPTAGGAEAGGEGALLPPPPPGRGGRPPLRAHADTHTHIRRPIAPRGSASTPTHKRSTPSRC